MKKIIILAAICLSFAATLSAQPITPIQLKQARMATYQWVEAYLACSYLSDKYDVKDYKNLFASNNIVVVNDYLPLTTDEQIILADYLEQFTSVDAFYSHIIETDKSSIYVISEDVIDGEYVCVLSIAKTISFTNSDTTYTYPPKRYTLEVALSYREEEMKCTRISTSDSLYVDAVLHNGNHSNVYILQSDTTSLLENNEHLPPIISKRIWHTTFDSKMLEIKKDTLKHNFHFGASIGYSCLTHNMVNNDFHNIDDKGDFSWGINMGMYHQLLMKHNSRIGIEYGISYRNDNYHFRGDYTISYNTNDPDGGNYLRLVSANNYKEHILLHSLSIPVALRYDYFIIPQGAIFGSIGAFASYDIVQKASAVAQTQYAGYYDWLFGVTIEQNGIYDFGNFEMQYKSNQTAIGKFNIGILAAIGFQYIIPKSKWSIEPSIRYQTSLYTPITHKADFHLTESNNHWQSATYLFKNIYKHNINFQINVNYNF